MICRLCNADNVTKGMLVCRKCHEENLKRWDESKAAEVRSRGSVKAFIARRQGMSAAHE